MLGCELLLLLLFFNVGQANRVSSLAAEKQVRRISQHVMKEENTYSNLDNLRRLALLLLREQASIICSIGCGFKPNCDKLDEKMKLSLSQGVRFAHLGCAILSVTGSD